MTAFSQSQSLWSRAERCLAGGPATLSKHPSRYPAGVSPLFFESASGCYAWDVDGRSYIDTVAALGPIILGHCDPVVTEAVVRQASISTSLTLPHPLEVEVAEMIQPLMPWREKTRVRFGKDGMAATNAAIRVARHATGGQHVIVCGYHGGADYYIATTEKNGGILPLVAEYTTQIPFGDVVAFERALHDIRHSFAGMILEVPPRPWGEDIGVVSTYLHHVKNAVQNAGGLFILDEIVTGFRYPFAWSMYGCVPDLICLGKGISNGYPLSALAGPPELMQAFDGGEVFWSTTFGGETIALAAAKATIDQLFTAKRIEAIREHGQTYGDKVSKAIVKNFGRLSSCPVTLLGNHARMILRWDDLPDGTTTGAALKTTWMTEHMYCYVLYGGPIFPMACWNAQIVDMLTGVADEVLADIALAIQEGSVEERLPCPVITDVFNTRYQETKR